MNFVADQTCKALVHELMPGERPHILKFGGNHYGFEVGIVVARNRDGRVIETGLD